MKNLVCILLFLFLLMICGCGGSGGDGSSQLTEKQNMDNQIQDSPDGDGLFQPNESQSINKQPDAMKASVQLESFSFLITFDPGCVWIAQRCAIEGLQYETDSLSGVTDENGTFNYYEGETIEFKTGDVVIGQIAAQDIAHDKIVTPIDLVPGARDIYEFAAPDIGPYELEVIESTLSQQNLDMSQIALRTRDQYEPAVSNITNFLQILDEDHISINGIEISPGTKEFLNDKTINFFQEQEEFGADPIFSEFLPVLFTDTKHPERETQCLIDLAHGFLKRNRFKNIDYYVISACEFWPGIVRVHYKDDVSIAEMIHLVESYGHDYELPRYFWDHESFHKITLIPENGDQLETYPDDWWPIANIFAESDLVLKACPLSVFDYGGDDDGWPTTYRIPGTEHIYLQLKPEVTYQEAKALIEAVGEFTECGSICKCWKDHEVHVPEGEENKWAEIYGSHDIVEKTELEPILKAQL